MRPALFLTVAALFAALPAAAQTTGDPVKGKAVFGQCAMCHSATAGKNGVGPSLFGVVGRTAGTVPGFSYSAAMKAAGPWTAEKLDAYVTAPQKIVPGTAMPYAGLKDATKRADLIAYLKTLK